MQIRDLAAADIEPVRQLLAANGWAHRVGSSSEFAALVASSQRNAVAVVDGKLAGYARGITDGISNGYLSMVVVAPDHRGRGVGSALVRHVVGSDPRVTWVVRAARDGGSAFFAKQGFASSSVAMERTRSAIGT